MSHTFLLIFKEEFTSDIKNGGFHLKKLSFPTFVMSKFEQNFWDALYNIFGFWEWFLVGPYSDFNNLKYHFYLCNNFDGTLISLIPCICQNF